MSAETSLGHCQDESELEKRRGWEYTKKKSKRCITFLYLKLVLIQNGYGVYAQLTWHTVKELILQIQFWFLTPEDYIMDDLCLKIRCAVCARLCFVCCAMLCVLCLLKYLGYFYCILLSTYQNSLLYVQFSGFRFEIGLRLWWKSCFLLQSLRLEFFYMAQKELSYVNSHTVGWVIRGSHDKYKPHCLQTTITDCQDSVEWNSCKRMRRR